MGELTRSFDWSKTVLGSPENWSPGLLTTISIILNSRFPMFLWWGAELIQFYNDAYRPSLGNTGKHPSALGQHGKDCWPEIWPIIKPMIDQVMSGGEATWNEDALIPIYRNDRLEDVYWTFSYSKVNDASGRPGGVLVICNETTGQVMARQQLEESYKKEQGLNEELSAINEELAEKNSELGVAQDKLRQSIGELEASEARFRFLVQQAPVAIGVLTGRRLYIESANDMMLKMWGKSAAILGMSLLDALPELQGQRFLKILDDVYTTGMPYYGNEAKVMLEQSGVLRQLYVNFIYQPLTDEAGMTTLIMVVAIDVTEQVMVRMELEKAQETLRQALSAAELGTFDIDLEKGTMEWDERCRALFGICHKDPVTYEKDFVKGLHPDDRERVTRSIEKVFIKPESGGDYDVEYRTIGADDQKIRWVRAKGKAYFDEQDRPLRFIGALLDISEQKSDELRKNDFIAMVSHELKTPLTSLNAIVQLLQAKFSNTEDTFSLNALNKANTQVRRMIGLINGFLNVSRLESSKIQLNVQHFDIVGLIKDILDETELTLSSHTIIFHPGEPVMLYSDREKIGSVISNLLTNAVKYSRDSKRIEVSCHVMNEMVQVSVKDEGMGIRPEDQQRLFERYYRVENENSRHISGFGIGLYLSAEIIQRHRGTIWVESEIGKGSTFYFRLPLGQPVVQTRGTMKDQDDRPAIP